MINKKWHNISKGMEEANSDCDVHNSRLWWSWCPASWSSSCIFAVGPIVASFLNVHCNQDIDRQVLENWRWHSLLWSSSCGGV
ncbi:hypothetical protein C5167_044778 [Papaver somniferum]|nr:hypothetical protein C5167_044778 [Papaver somniferum]